MRIDEITEAIVGIRDHGVETRSDRDALAEAANKLQAFKKCWHEIFAQFSVGDSANQDGILDLTAEQIERCIALAE